MAGASPPEHDRGPISSPGSQRWVLIAAILGSSLVFLDQSTVNVAVPALQEAFDATVVDVQWVVNGYRLFLASLMLLGGSLGDRLGRRKVFAVGVALFTVASLACGLAPTAGFLIAARALEGIGGALLTPGSLALIHASFPGDDRGKAIGVWSGFSALTPAVGPVLGGWLIDVASWRWIFLMNVPLALVVLAIAILRVPESRESSARGRPDVLGSILVTAGLAGVTFALIESSRGVADPRVLAAAGIGLLFLAAFPYVEHRAPAPILPPSLFRSRTFSGVNVLTLLLYANLSGLLFFLPMLLIQIRGYSATAAGAATLPFALLLFLLSRASGGLMDRIGPRLPLTVGSSMVAGAFVAFAYLPTAVPGYAGGILPPIVLLGLGMALVVAPLTTTVMAAVPEDRAGTASGVNNAISRVAGLLAVAGFGALMLGIFATQLDARLHDLDLRPAVQEHLTENRNDLGELSPPPDVEPDLRDRIQDRIDGAFLASFRTIMLVMAGLSAIGAALAWATVRNPRDADGEETSPGSDDAGP